MSRQDFESSSILVKDIMTQAIISVPGETTVFQVAKMMEQGGIGAVLVKKDNIGEFHSKWYEIQKYMVCESTYLDKLAIEKNILLRLLKMQTKLKLKKQLKKPSMLRLIL